jgi:hypothetical protein
MLYDLDDDLATGSGPSRSLATRVKLDVHARLLAVLASTGETPAELVRRLVLVHLDAMAVGMSAAT